MKPVCVVDYTGNTAGVDKSDHLPASPPKDGQTVEKAVSSPSHSCYGINLYQTHCLYKKK